MRDRDIPVDECARKRRLGVKDRRVLTDEQLRELARERVREDEGEYWMADVTIVSVDSLAIHGDTLVRRTPFVIGLTQSHQIVGVTEERYTPR